VAISPGKPEEKSPMTRADRVLPKDFRPLAWSNLAAQSAEQVGLAAAPLLAVLAFEAGAGGTGLLAAVQTLPFLLLSLPAGVLVDRFSPRALMLGAEGLRAAALLAVPALALLGLLSLPLLAAIGFAAAVGTVVFSVAAPSLVAALVPRAALALANGRLELARSSAFAAGPALGGALVAWAGAAPAFIAAGLLSLAAMFLVRRVPSPAPAAARPRRALLGEAGEGARFAWRHHLLRPILLTAVAWNVAWFVLQAAYIPYAVHRLGLGADAIGATLGAYGAGMVAGALLAPRAVAALRLGAVIALGPLVSVAAAAAMALSLALPGATLPVIAFFLFGAGPILWTIGQTTLRQAVTPASLLGRVSALMMMATTGARPLGAALGGLVGAAWGAEAAIALAAAGFLVQALILLASRVPRLAALPEGPKLAAA
jgi:predicted MFS family arabinose efflux permease